MNKTIIININGIVFHIEEDAYEILRNYMTDVKRHFAYTADSDEIVSDIENRIAEMFVERLETEKKQVVVMQDVQDVTAQMGSVSDFDQESEDAPSGNLTSKSDRRLFRDTDDRIIGGVCSGIAHYFNVEPKWIRVIAVIIFFLAGSGLALYLILWIAMPKARTRADKMAMKGEQPNLQNFKKNFDEEVEALHHNLKKAQHEARPALGFLRALFGHLGTFFEEFFGFIAKALGVFILFIGAAALIAMIVGLFVLVGWSTTDLDFPPFNTINAEYKSFIYFSAFLIIVIPLTALVFFAIRVLFNRTILTKTGSFAMLILWIAGLCMGAYYGTKLGAEFKEEASFSETIDIKESPVYYLKLNDAKFLTREDSIKYNVDSKRIILNRSDDWNDNRRMRIHIERADVNKPVLIKTFSSHGPDFETGLKSAQRINYYFEQTDSVLQFDRVIRLNKNELWRDQDIRLTLRIPQNTRLVIDRDMDWYIQDANLWYCFNDEVSGDIPFQVWMTAEGLKCDTIESKKPKHKERDRD